MKRLQKLQKNIDNRLLTIKHIGSRGEGVSNLTTEINFRKSDYTFFIPFTLPDEIVVVKPILSTSEGIRASLVEIWSYDYYDMTPYIDLLTETTKKRFDVDIFQTHVDGLIHPYLNTCDIILIKVKGKKK